MHIYIHTRIYIELNDVSQIITNAFYTKPNQRPWKGIFKLSELNRLQQNFPYNKDEECHEMFVAIRRRQQTTNNDDDDDQDTVIGFVDIDGRALPPEKEKMFPPRPYLSDLAVDTDHRRKGIARSLVEHCHEYLINFYNNDKRNNDESDGEGSKITQNDDTEDKSAVGVYIRVAKDNEAAVQLYTQPPSSLSTATSCLDYQIIKEEKDKTLGDVWLLYKNLSSST